jgi:MYXO-CTERM domain-containing protein
MKTVTLKPVFSSFRPLIALVMLLLLAPAPAAAFHSAMLFPDDASVGGGGGLFYNGSPRHNGYTCAACHVGGPGLARLEVRTTPDALAAKGTYEPGVVYSFAIALASESRGLDSAVNYNTFGVEVIDADALPVGEFQNFAAGDMVTTIALDALFARGQNNSGATAWSFDWTAPPAGAGPVHFYFSGVDGDGAGATEAPETDTLGDDVMVLQWTAYEAGTPRPVKTEAGCGTTPSPASDVPWMLLFGVGAAVGWRRRYSEPA